MIDKAPGLVVHPARGHREGTLAQLLGLARRGRRSEPQRAGIVHRLDRDTSGLLVVARSDEAHRLLQAALAERRIEREYLALVEGRPPARSGTIEAPIGRDPRVRTRMAVGGVQPARGAHPLHARARARRTSRCCGCAWRPGAPTRSACTCRRSATRCAATPSTAAAGPARPGAPVPARRAPGLRASVHRRAVEVASPLPADLQGALERAERAILSGSIRSSTRAVIGSRPCPDARLLSSSGSAATRTASQSHTQREYLVAQSRHSGAAGGRRSLRPPDAPLEPEDAPLHPRRARRHLHHRPAQDLHRC